MKKIIISPWSAKPISVAESAKNYPYWTELVQKFQEIGLFTVQIGVNNEKLIGTHEVLLNKSFKELDELIRKSDYWISVDNFLQHMVNATSKKPGIVLWGKSNPKHFGYEYNQNILKDKKYLRQQQFKWWHDEPFEAEVFYKPNELMQLLKDYLM